MSSLSIDQASTGLRLLHETFNDLSKSRAVDRACRKNSPQRALERIQKYLTRLETTASKPKAATRLELKVLRSYCIDIADKVLVEKIAKKIFESEHAELVNHGRAGDFPTVSFEKYKNDYIKLVHEKYKQQKASLYSWIKYLKVNNGEYPSWYRYLVLRELKKMGRLDIDNKSFTKRTKDTVVSYPDLNAEAIGFVYKALIKELDLSYYNFTEEQKVRLQELQQKRKFSELYAFALVELNKSSDRTRHNGKWTKYCSGSNHKLLERDLSGKGTGWCTATGSASAHLASGDFYVYYTEDSSGSFSVPRVAIRMVGGEIFEIRGVNPGQELEPEFLNVVKEKGRQLSGYDKYVKAEADMKQLTKIYNKCSKVDINAKTKQYLDPILTSDEIIFLYEIKSEIKSFGYSKDPRIKELCDLRNKKNDFAQLAGCSADQVAESEIEVTKNTKVFLCAVDFAGKNGVAAEIFNSSSALHFFGEVSCVNQNAITRIPAGSIFHSNANFSRCTALSQVPNDCVFSGSVSFSCCTELKSIGYNITFENDARFDGCSSLTTIANNTTFSSDVRFDDCKALKKLPPVVVFKGYAWFNDCIELEKIEIGAEFRGDAWFENCKALKTVNKGVKFGGNALFQGCTSLVSIGEGVVFKKDANFQGCESLSHIQNNVEFHGEAIFDECRRLASLGENLKFSSVASFRRCVALVCIPTGTIFNGKAFFNGCTSLESIEDRVKFDDAAMFYDCTSLYKIGDGIKFNKEAWFNGCRSLKWIPSSLTFKSEAWFNDCISLETIPKNTVFLGKACFQGCTGLTNINEEVFFNSEVWLNNCPALEIIDRSVTFNRQANLDLPLSYYQSHRILNLNYLKRKLASIFSFLKNNIRFNSSRVTS